MNRNKHETAVVIDSNVHLATESDQGPALPKAVEWLLRQTKEARLQELVVLWRLMWVFAVEKIQDRPW
jgi:hypothetical protein